MTLLKRFAAALLALLPLTALADNPFSPSGPTVTLAVTGTTARALYQPTASGPNVRIYNAGTVAVFIVCGTDNTAVATVAAGMPIAPGTVEIIGCGGTYIAGISAGTAATVYLTPGYGV